MVSSAARVGSINVLFTAKYDQAVAGTNRLASEVERGSGRMLRSVRGVDRGVIGLNATMSRLNGRQFNVLALSALRAENSVNRLKGVLVATSALIGGFGAAFSVKGAIEYSDTYKSIGNRLRVVKGEAQDLRDVERDIFDISQRTRSTYESTGVLFSRMAGASKRLGISQRDILRVTETIQKAMLVGGATPTEAAQSSIQLSQGLASDRLQGDELRSVLENPALGQLLADRITDGDLGKLREMAAAGELTARVVVNAFKSASGEIDKMFAGTEQTVTHALVKVDNALMRYIGTSKNANEASRATVSLLNAVAENFEGIADTLGLVGAAVISAYGGRGLSSLRAFSVASKQALVDNAQNAKVALEVANAERARATQTLASARAAYEMAKASTVAATTRAKFGRELHAALAAELAATKGQAAATIGYGRALGEASLRGRAFAAAGRASAAAWAFIGGPWGVALAAIGTAYYVLSSRSQEVAERTERVRDELSKMGIAADDAADSVDGTKRSLEDLASDQIRTKLRDINGELDRIRGEQGWFDKLWSYDEQSLGNLKTELTEIVGGSSGDVRKGAAAQLLEVIRLAEEGKTPVEELNARLADIADVGLDQPMNDLIDRIRSAISYLANLTQGAKKLGDVLGAAAGRFPMSGWRAAEDSSMESYRALEADRQKYFDQLSTEAGRTQWEADVERKADEILKGAEELGLALTRSAAKVQAEAILLKERTTANIGGAISGFVDRTIQAESGGNPNAKNPRSSATGAGQFINSTWLDQFRKVYPSVGMSEPEILDLRSNLEISKRLIENYARENAAMLERAGIAVQSAADEYKLQLAHFLGPQGAIDILKAAPGTPVSSVLGAKQISANPEVLGGGKTVDDVIAYGQKRAGMTTAGTQQLDANEAFGKSLEEYKAYINGLKEETAIRATLNPLVNDYGQKMSTVEAAQRLLSEAQKEGTAAGKELSGVQQLLSGDLSKLSPAAREQAEAMRALAVEAGNAEAESKRLTESQEALKDGYDQLGQVGIGALRGIAGALSDGKLEAHEILSIVIDLIEQLGAIPNLGSIMGGGGGGGWLSALFGGGFGAGASDPWAGMRGVGGGAGGLLGGFLIPGILHKGGDANSPNSYRPIPLSSITRAHQGEGLKHGELLRVLEDTETVLTGSNTDRSIVALGEAASRLKGGRTYSPTYNIDARGSQMTEAQFKAVLDQRDKRMVKTIDVGLPSMLNQHRMRGNIR